MRRRFWTLAALLCATNVAAAPKKPAQQPVKEAPAEPDKKKSGAPSAPPPRKQEGPSGVRVKDGTCPPNLVLTPKGTVMRSGMGLNFALFHLMREDRCLPKVTSSPDGNWTMLEFEQGKGGWVQTGSAPLPFGDAPPLPAGTPLFDAKLGEATLGYVEPSLLAPIVGVISEGQSLQVHAVSADGLMYQVSDAGKSLGWILKGMVTRAGDDEQRSAGSGAWAPPPLPQDQRDKGSLDALAPLPADAPSPEGTPATSTTPAVDAPPTTPEAVANAEGPLPVDPKAKPPEEKKPEPSPLSLLTDRPKGRGLHVGVGLVGAYFYERFSSNSFNDPIGNYRIDTGTTGLSLDVAYRSHFGLVMGARLQGHVFGLSDTITGPLQLIEGIDATRRSITDGAGAGGGAPGAPQAPDGVFGGSIIPLLGSVQSLNLWMGWRVFAAQDMDLDLFVGYASKLVLFGKQFNSSEGDVDGFSDLWYHSVRPGVRLLYRPLGGKFGALASEAAIGAGFVVPMFLKLRSSCEEGQLDRCHPFEETYGQDPNTGRLIRRGLARPPPFTGFDLRSGYLYDAGFVVAEVGLQAMLRYSAVFYTQQEGFAKRNRYYDRASNIDFLAGPYVTLRGGI